MYRNLSTDAVRNAKFVLERNLSSQVKTNSNLFWKHARNCTKVKSNVGILERNDGSTTETDYEAANVLNTFFTSVFTKEPINDIPCFPNKSNGKVSSDITISHEDRNLIPISHVAQTKSILE